MGLNKLSERDICTKYITPAIKEAGWDIQTQVREEVSFTKGRIIVRGKLHSRGEQKRADYILYYKTNIPIAIIEAKDNTHSVGAGMQQALNYAETLEIPFVFSSNGDAFLMHDRTGNAISIEKEVGLHQFPSPAELWLRYCEWKGIKTEQAKTTVEMPYYDDGSGRAPRYYQASAVNNTIEAVARGQQHILLVMATGTGKTYTAFQIIWRLWKSGTKKRILFLADRNILVDQTKNNDFKPFGAAMTKISKRQIDKSYEIYLSLYQAVTGVRTAKDSAGFSSSNVRVITKGSALTDAPAIDETKAMAFYSADYEEFKQGTLELSCKTCSLKYYMNQVELRRLHDTQDWRGLAQMAIKIGYQFDLSYYYLGAAAKGLGFINSSKIYFKKANELSANDETSCMKTKMINCYGVDIAAASDEMAK